MLAPYTKKDTHPMSWEEMSGLVDALISDIHKHFSERGEQVHVIAPLLRTGGIVGGMLAIRMRVLTMLPVQFKYTYNPTVIQQILSVPDILTATPSPMNVLLCEGNTGTGSIAKRAATAIHEKYPHANIYLATLTKVYGGPDTLDGIARIFFGRMTDEHFKANAEEKRALNLREGITIFPWENADEELADINAAA